MLFLLKTILSYSILLSLNPSLCTSKAQNQNDNPALLKVIGHETPPRTNQNKVEVKQSGALNKKVKNQLAPKVNTNNTPKKLNSPQKNSEVKDVVKTYNNLDNLEIVPQLQEFTLVLNNNSNWKSIARSKMIYFILNFFNKLTHFIHYYLHLYSLKSYDFKLNVFKLAK